MIERIISPSTSFSMSSSFFTRRYLSRWMVYCKPIYLSHNRLRFYSNPTKSMFDKSLETETTRAANRYRFDETETVYD